MDGGGEEKVHGAARGGSAEEEEEEEEKKGEIREMGKKDKTVANKGGDEEAVGAAGSCSQLGTEDNKLLIRAIYPGRDGDLCPNSSR